MNRRDFKVKAAQARALAARYAEAERRGGVGVAAALDARCLAIEWFARAELAEVYAARAQA